MSDYQSTVRRHRRLAILRHLEQCADFTSNASILVDVLDGVGVVSSRDQVLSELNWLQEQDLITLTDHSGFVIAEATLSGVEIARGRASNPGIQRPSPRG